MQEDVIYRCINPACARPMPRRVNFCPWCGTAQGQAVARAGADAGTAATTTAAAAAANAGAAAAAAMSGWVDMPLPPDPPDPPVPAAPPQSPPPPPPSPPAQGTARGAQVPPSATDFGRSASAGRGAGPAPGPAQQEVPRPPIPARPARRKPVQLRWWILALAILWAVWLLAKPSTRRIERQIDHAEALARECKGSEAQSELIALRGSRATPEQLERLQKTLNDQSAICTKRRQRNKAWLDASTAADAALDAGNADKARTRLQGFIRRWGEDEKTRALKARIDEAAAREQHPLAVPNQAGVGVGRVDSGV